MKIFIIGIILLFINNVNANDLLPPEFPTAKNAYTFITAKSSSVSDGWSCVMYYTNAAYEQQVTPFIFHRSQTENVSCGSNSNICTISFTKRLGSSATMEVNYCDGDILCITEMTSGGSTTPSSHTVPNSNFVLQTGNGSVIKCKKLVT